MHAFHLRSQGRNYGAFVSKISLFKTRTERQHHEYTQAYEQACTHQAPSQSCMFTKKSIYAYQSPSLISVFKSAITVAALPPSLLKTKTKYFPSGEVPRNHPRRSAELPLKQPMNADLARWALSAPVPSTRTHKLTLKSRSGKPEQEPSCTVM
jgi:hypothetical protein